MKPLLLDLKDRSQGDLPPQGRLVKFLRRILGLKDPLADGSAPLRPSIVERLDDFFAHDRPKLNEVLPRLESHAAKPGKDMETASSSERGRIQAPAHAAPPALHGPRGKEQPIRLVSPSPRDYSLVQELRARTARNRGRHRKLIFACLSVSVLILILGAAVIFVRRQAARKAEPSASSSPIAAQVSAPSDTEPLPEATPDSGTPETQPSPTNPDGQPGVQAQPSDPAASPSVVGKVTPPAAPPKKVAPPAEKPAHPGSALSVIAPEPSRPAPAPPLQMQAPAKTPEGTANRSTGLQADTGRAEEASGSLGASGITEGRSGVRITQITADGPAAQAGLRVGDIITELDGVPVRMARILDAQIALHKPGSKIRISYIRNSSPGNVTVTVGKRVTP